MSALICSECGKPLPQSKRPERRKGTRCRPCIAASVSRMPGVAEKKSQTQRKKFEDPQYLALHSARIKAGIRKSMERPERLEQMRERGRLVGTEHLGFRRFGPGSPERIAAAKKSAETKMAWCPHGYRADYRATLKILGDAAAAREVTLNQIRADIVRLSKGLVPLSDFVRVRDAARYLADQVAGQAA